MRQATGTNARAIDDTLAALANPARRSIVDRLLGGSATVGEIAAPHDMTLSAVSQHLKVLEGAGLVRRSKQGRVHRCELDAAGIAGLLDWADTHRRFWEDRLDSLKSFAERRDESTR